MFFSFSFFCALESWNEMKVQARLDACVVLVLNAVWVKYSGGVGKKLNGHLLFFLLKPFHVKYFQIQIISRKMVSFSLFDCISKNAPNKKIIIIHRPLHPPPSHNNLPHTTIHRPPQILKQTTTTNSQIHLSTKSNL